MTRAFTWGIKKLGIANLLGLALLGVALGGFCLGLVDTVKGLDFDTLFRIALLAVLVTGLFTTLRNGWLVLPLTIVIGFVTVLTIVGNLGGSLWLVVQTFATFSIQRLAWPHHLPDATYAANAIIDLLTQANVLLVRVRDWGAAIQMNQPTYDPVATVLVWSWVTWVVAAWAGWHLKFNRAFAALLPALVVLGAVASYAGRPPVYFLPLIASLLLLLPLTGHRARERAWRQTRTDYSEDIRHELSFTTSLITVVLVAAAAFGPEISINNTIEWFRKFTSTQTGPANPVASSLGLAAASDSTFEQIRIVGLPRSHLIGAGPELSQRVVMTVDVIGAPAPPSDDLPILPFFGPSGQPPSIRYYWRTVTYDVYMSRGWVTSPLETLEYAASELIQPAPPAGSILVRQEVRTVEDMGGVVVAAGALATVGTDFKATWRTGDDLFSVSTVGPAYQVESYLANPTQDELRTASNQYPTMIAARYLQLPDTLPSRVITLARELTATADNPYDRAKAIEAYLRRYPYTLDLPKPPSNRDVADYFIFDLKRGYCDYYATSMVVLARAAGLPARLVSGYVRGRYDIATSRYFVTEADAHSWVEIYFPGYGWVEFEPTGGQPVLEHGGSTLEPTLGPLPALPIPQPEEAPEFIIDWLPTLVWGFMIVFFVSQLWGVLDRFRLGRMSPAQTAASLYARLNQRTNRLLVSHDTGDTPYELARAMHAYFAPDVITAPPWMEDIHTIVNLYVKAAYSPQAPTKTEQRNAIQRWGRLQWWLWQAKMFMPVESLLRSLARALSRLRLNTSKMGRITKD